VTTLLTFRDKLEAAAPPWLRNAWGSRLLYSIGVSIDALIEATTLGIKARFPGHAPSDALPYIGRERQIRRGIDEPDESYAQRLTQWVDDRRMRGCAQATMRQLQGYMAGHAVPVSIVNPHGAWHSLSAAAVSSYHHQDPTNWDWDGNAAAWSRYWVILYPPADLWTDDGTWDDPGTWDDGGTWDTTATPEQVATVRAIVAEWNPPHAMCAGILIALNGADYSPLGSGAGFPAGDWGTWGHLDGTHYEAVRADETSYWDGI
jgi:hypothetical protein